MCVCVCVCKMGEHIINKGNVISRCIWLSLPLQTSVGVLRSFSLWPHHVSLSLSELRLRAADVIVKCLTRVNSLVILSGDVTQTMAALG